MAIEVQTVSTNGPHDFGTTDTIVLPKPTDTINGDLLIAAISHFGATVDTVPSGWTLVKTTDTDKVSTYYKIASSEGASWNWVISTNSAYPGGICLRIDGHDGDNPINVSSAGSYDDNNQNPSFTPGITPTTADTLIIMTVIASASSAVSSYALTTDDISWSEQADIANGTSLCLSMATGIRNETSATGNFTCSLSASSSDGAGQIMAIEPGVLGSTSNFLQLF